MTQSPRLGVRVIMLIMFSLIMIGMSNDAWARSGNALSWCDDGAAFQENRIFASVIGCLETELHDTTLQFIEGAYVPISEYVSIFLILAMILYGANTMMGTTDRLAVDSMKFLLKLAFVFYFMQPENAIEVYEQFDAILKGTTTEVSSLAMPNSNLNLRCPVPSTGRNIETTKALWERADCIINLLIGLNSSNGENDGLKKGMMAFFFYNLQSGAIGVLIGIIGLYIAFNLLLALFRASYTYIAALIKLSFLFIIGLLFVPLIVLGSTYEFFSRWFKNVMAVVLQPVLLFLYLNILLTAFDIMLYSGSHSIMSVVTGSAGTGQNLQEYAENNDLYKEDCSRGFTHDTRQTGLELQEPQKDLGALGNAEYYPDKPDPAKNSNELRIDLEYRCIDYTRIEGGSAALAGAVLLVGLTSFVMISFLNQLPAIIQELAGGRHNVADIIAGAGVLQLPFTRQVQSVGTGMNNLMSNNIGRLIGGR